jgi:TATA-binding protein-associated factor
VSTQLPIRWITTGTPRSSRARLIAKEDRPSPKTERSFTNGSSNGTSSDKVVVDPTKGGAVNPKNDKQSKALEVRPGTWIWDGIANILEVDLFSQAWEVRHGAAMCLRELLKLQGKSGGMKGRFLPSAVCVISQLALDGQTPEENDIAHERWCNNLAAKLLCVSVLDRFGDFVSDQVIKNLRYPTSTVLTALNRWLHPFAKPYRRRWLRCCCICHDVPFCMSTLSSYK